MAKSLMILGTMSDVGKSFIVTGLCRILAQDGHRVAPFKSQNMACNSFITDQGLEIGLAQALQAEAAGVTPMMEMNPLLLKPDGKMGSRVIVGGKVLGHQSGKTYGEEKQSHLPLIEESYRTLEKKFDVIVIEGAGSPVELNLNHRDIVNMGVANLVDAPCLLVGDIQRGGVFASLFGTMALLPPAERSRIKGTIINQFKGDVTLFHTGKEKLEQLTKVPLLGILPASAIYLEQEDRRDDKEKSAKEKALGKAGYEAYKEQEYDRIAELLREHLDMEAIYDIIFK